MRPGLAPCTAGVLMALAPHAGSAQEPPSRPLPLEELVVSATRAERALGDVPANVTVLTRDAIVRSAAQTVPDLLRTIPGFTMRDHQSNLVAHPTRQGASLRGLTGTSAGRTLVLVDGVPLTDPFGGWVHWSRVPLDLVERVEVVRGGGSAVWGNQALGGVINIITRDPASSGLTVRAEGGRPATVRAGGLATHGGGRFGVSVSGEYFETGGYRTVREDLRGPIDIDVDSQNETAYAKLRYDVSSVLELHLHGSYLNETRKNGTEFRDVQTDIGFIRGGAEWTTPSGGRLAWTGFGSVQDHANRFSSEAPDRATETPSLDQFDVPATALGSSLNWARRIATHQLTAGADVLWVDGEINERFLWLGDRFGRERHLGGETLLGGLYVADVVRISPALELTANARLDLWNTREGVRRERDLETSEVLRDTEFASRTEWTFNWNAGARLQLSPPTSLRGSLYRGFRAPTLNELYKPFRAPGNVVADANPLLEPERVLGAELGIDHALDRSLLARGTLFWNHVENPIVDVTIEEAGESGRPIDPCGFVPAGGVCLQRQNLGSFRSVGMEAELEFRPTLRWLMAGAYTLNPTEVVDAPAQPGLEGARNKGAAIHQFTLQAGWSDPALIDASVTGRYVGRRFEDDLNTLELAGFFVLDARLARRIGSNWQAYLEAENLFDTAYEVSRSTSGLVRVGGPFFLRGGVRLRLD